MTASELLCGQLGLKPAGEIESARSVCIMCGVQIKPGQPRTRFRASSSFMDGPELCARNASSNVCGCCVYLTDKPLMMRIKNVCITRTQMLSAAKLVHKHWLLRNPPQPPFVLVLSDKKSAHLVWKTQVTEDENYWYVRLGERLLTIRMPLVRRALEQFADISRRFEETQRNSGKKPPNSFRHPFTSLDFWLRDLRMGELRYDVEPYLKEEDRRLLVDLRIGELWALGIMTTKQAPEQPAAAA
jgi:CRISPR type IV-associated protein Csf1